MIIARIVGGLGNQIACYAFGRFCADMLGVDLKLDISAYREYKLHDYCLDRFTLAAQVASEAEIAAAKRIGVIVERTLLFDPSIQGLLRDGVYLDGYWGDYRYAEAILPVLRTGFQPAEPLGQESDAVLERIRAASSVSLHIRRGDYVTNPNCVVLPLTYYEDAVREILHRVPAAHLFIFSDDPDWVEAHLQPACPCTFVRHNDARRNVEDFQLMRSCRHHIIANSSFSFWAARLDSKQGGLVIAPQQYFKPEDPYLMQSFGTVAQPVWPSQWTVMPIRVPTTPNATHPLLGIAGGDSRQHPIRIGVWNYYEELTTDGYIFKNANAPIGHDLLKPWGDLHAYGQAHGMDFVTLDQVAGPEELDAVVFMDRPRMDNPMVARILGSGLAKYLCLWETEVIKPDNWDLAFHARFDRIFTWSDEQVDHRRYIKVNSAIDPEPPYDFAVLKTAFHQRKLCTLIAGAKTAFHPNELYSERIQAIRWFETHAANDFDLFGVGWKAEDFPSYRGSVQDKLAVLSHYRFAICYENARNYPGYITEKLLDCFRAGVVPVYLGAPNIEHWIPRDCFIDLNAFRDYAHLHAFLATMDAPTHGGYLDRIQAFLGSSKAYPFTTECFITTLTGYIARDVQTRRGEIPDVTVVIPAYNYGRFLGLALESALAQAVERLEVLVLDNASTDETPEVLARFAADSRVRAMRNTRNIGGPQNWQNVLKIASGRYVTILSADDFFLPGHLPRMVERMDEHPHISLAYCPCIWVDEASKPMYVLNHPGHAPQDYLGERNEVADLLRFDCYITPSAALIRRTALDAVGGLDTSLAGAIDWDLWIRIAEQAPDFTFFKDAKVCYRVHPGQDTTFQVSSANILKDHISILWNALERGRLHHFRDQSNDVLAALWKKYALFPREMAAHFEPHLVELERLIKDPDETDYRAVRRAVYERTDQSRLAKPGGEGFRTVPAREGFWSERRLLLVKRICELRKQFSRSNDLGALEEAERLQKLLGKHFLPLFLCHKLTRPWQNLKRSLEKRRSKGSRYLQATIRGPVVSQRAPATEAASALPPDRQSAAAVKEAFLFEPDWGRDDWIKVLQAYLEAFRPGAPVLLVFLMAPEHADQLGLVQAQAEVVRVARQVAAAAIPDVALVDKPEELLDLLRGYEHIQWVRLACEDMPAMTGALGHQLAEALGRQTSRLAQPAPAASDTD